MASEAPVQFFKKRKGKGPPSGLRKKEAVETPESTSDSPSTSEVVIAPKKQTTSHLIQGTSNKRRKTQESTEGLDLSDSDDDKQRESYAVRHSASSRRERRRSSSPPAWVSTEAIKAQAKDKNAPPEEVKDDGLYRGTQGEKHKLPKAFGPIKGGPANVRTITLTDYQPDVCKDYKGLSLFPRTLSCS
jgi:RING finger protein 113A